MKTVESCEFATVILPVYGNVSQIWELVARLDSQFEVVGIEGEILLIDDGSGPEAWKEILRICNGFPRAKGIRFTRNFGQHAAIRAGLEMGAGTVFILMDADLENRPEDIPVLFKELQETQLQIVIGKWGDSGGKQVFSGLFHRLVAEGAYDHDEMRSAATFRIFTRLIRDELLKYREHDAVFGPIMHRLGFPIGYVAITRDTAKAPPSRYTFGKRWKLAQAELVGFVTRIALRTCLVVGAVAVSVALAIAVFTVFRFEASGGNIFSTNSLYGLVIALLIGYMSVSISILIFLMKNILLQSRSRPTYHIAEVFP